MLYLLVKAVVSGVLIATISEVARRNPGLGRSARLAAADLADRDHLAVARHQ